MHAKVVIPYTAKRIEIQEFSLELDAFWTLLAVKEDLALKYWKVFLYYTT